MVTTSILLPPLPRQLQTDLAMANPTTLNLVCGTCNIQIGPLPPAPSNAMYLVGCGHVVCMDHPVLDLFENEDDPPLTIVCLRCRDNMLLEPCTRLNLLTVDFTTGGDTPDMVLLREQEARLLAEVNRLYQQVSAEVALCTVVEDCVKDLENGAGMS
ncbi:hypothetical protein FRC12_010945 [Ceratobasidium sp. 428]|nr:hypothetical protein FRC12_010945 [Ceratobasidium sp. 428]